MKKWNVPLHVLFDIGFSMRATTLCRLVLRLEAHVALSVCNRSSRDSNSIQHVERRRRREERGTSRLGIILRETPLVTAVRSVWRVVGGLWKGDTDRKELLMPLLRRRITEYCLTPRVLLVSDSFGRSKTLNLPTYIPNQRLTAKKFLIALILDRKINKILELFLLTLNKFLYV